MIITTDLAFLEEEICIMVIRALEAVIENMMK